MTEAADLQRNGFAQGVAWAVQVLLTHFDQETIALGLLNQSGLSLTDLEAAGAADYDLEPIRAAIDVEGEE